ncbi:MAG TPA: hypothetical protein PKY81_12070 [bacterium]|nr:hypothetical protein [bacterium]
MYQKNIVIDGNYICRNYSDLINGAIFKKTLIKFLEQSKNDEHITELLNNIRSNKIDNLILFFSLLSQFPLKQEKIYKKTGFSFLAENRYLIKHFTLKFYDFWRSHNRFMIKHESFPENQTARAIKKYEFCECNESLKLTILNLFRQINENIAVDRNKVFRQITASAECSFLTKTIETPFAKAYKQFKSVKTVWFVSLLHPVIYYTLQNKRTGLTKITEENLLKKSRSKFSEFICFPLMVGNYFIHVYTHPDFLHLGASLANLMELADVEKLSEKPDGAVVFGLEENLFNGNHAGLVYEDDVLNMPIGCVPKSEIVDYFGYMKKMILTIHNIICIKENNLPIHGAFAKISLKSGESLNIMFIGDSGAGKSETLEALNKLQKQLKSLEIYIDDMGSVFFANKECVAVGAEIGAFVRLDDLDPGYAYNAIDRAIFMNPNTKNARVIIPFADYFTVSSPHKIDMILYANNYDKPSNEDDVVKIFDNPMDAYEIFEEGKRMAKGTTNESGITTSYFSNPFGAVQYKTLHDKIAKKYFSKFKEFNVKVGEIKTQLGVEGFEQKGPETAAKSLIKLIKQQ